MLGAVGSDGKDAERMRSKTDFLKTNGLAEQAIT